MFAVIFKVQPKRERWDDYLNLAKQLKPQLEAIDGFIDNERFRNVSRDGVVLSLSTWRDEKAVVRWRTQGEHHNIQEKGRREIFEDYHLRVGEITRDSHPPVGLDVTEQRFDETAVRVASTCTITELTPDSSNAATDVLRASLESRRSAAGLVTYEVFASITNPGKQLILASWRDQTSARAWQPSTLTNAVNVRHRAVRVIRDYGMFERREAPQYHLAVAGGPA